MSSSCYSTLAGTDLNMVLGATSGTSGTSAVYTIPRADARKICIGPNSYCGSPSGVVIGGSASIETPYYSGGVAIGEKSSLSGLEGIGVAIGNSASTSGGVAIGTEAHDNYGSGVAIGQGATTTITGSYSSAYENGPVSIGYQSGSKHGGVAIGAVAGCEEKAVAIGAWSKATSGSIAIGYNASASGMGDRALSIGYNARIYNYSDADTYNVFIGVGDFAIRMTAFDFINTFACMGGQSGSWDSEQGKYVFN